jgi:hypothetical protein
VELELKEGFLTDPRKPFSFAVENKRDGKISMQTYGRRSYD